ncbi:MAG TPA: LpxD N-terminal domain-containing protein, partial [Thermoanaerobaculia bacterium]
MGYRLAELAAQVGGRVEGDPERIVEAIRPLESAGPRDLSFLKDPRYRGQAAASGAGALLVGPSLVDAAPGRDLL